MGVQYGSDQRGVCELLFIAGKLYRPGLSDARAPFWMLQSQQGGDMFAACPVDRKPRFSSHLRRRRCASPERSSNALSASSQRKRRFVSTMSTWQL